MTHVKSAGLAASPDGEVWDFAKRSGLAILSKDSDFHQMSFLFGPPPKVIWLRCGNASTSELRRVLEANLNEVRRFLSEDESAFLIIR